MSLPNYVTETLAWLDTQANGGNWDTTTFDHPILVNRDNSERLDTNVRETDIDLTNGNVIGVSGSPQQDNTSIDPGFNYRVRDGVSVRIEALHEDQYGHVASDSDFKTLRDEARRSILVERVRPTSDPGTLFLTIESENNNSGQNSDYYRYDFDVWFLAHEDLP